VIHDVAARFTVSSGAFYFGGADTAGAASGYTVWPDGPAQRGEVA